MRYAQTQEKTMHMGRMLPGGSPLNAPWSCQEYSPDEKDPTVLVLFDWSSSMWTVMAVFDGKPPQYIEFAQVEGEHRLLADLLPMARERWGDHSGIPWHVMEAVSKRQPAPWADPIPLSAIFLEA
jgi:hypothetical protein